VYDPAGLLRSVQFTHCRAFYGVKGGLSFDDAVDKLKSGGRDSHFNLQSHQCSGRRPGSETDGRLTDVLPLFSHVERFDGDIRAKTRTILHRLLTDAQFDAVYPEKNTPHATGAASAMRQYYRRGRPWLVGMVVDHYFEDYATFRIALPAFAWEDLIALREAGSGHALSDERMEAMMNYTNAADDAGRAEGYTVRKSVQGQYILEIRRSFATHILHWTIVGVIMSFILFEVILFAKKHCRKTKVKD